MSDVAEPSVPHLQRVVDIRQHVAFSASAFLLISGYIIARILGKETALPLLLMAALTLWVLGHLHISASGYASGCIKTPFVEVFTLLNYTTHPQVILAGSAWSLVI